MLPAIYKYLIFVIFGRTGRKKNTSVYLQILIVIFLARDRLKHIQAIWKSSSSFSSAEPVEKEHKRNLKNPHRHSLRPNPSKNKHKRYLKSPRRHSPRSSPPKNEHIRYLKSLHCHSLWPNPSGKEVQAIFLRPSPSKEECNQRLKNPHRHSPRPNVPKGSTSDIRKVRIAIIFGRARPKRSTHDV